MGARLPARLLPARRRRALARRAGDRGLDGDGDARRWRRTSSAGSACATRSASRRASTGRTSRSRSSGARTSRPPTAGSRPRWPSPARCRAIVYAGTRADCERLAERLGPELGVEVIAYHAGLPREARAEAQRRFMAGEAPVVVATNAFGMGVDKANVRTVCHESVPSSIEAYYQEAGRAGRDGKPARCLLFATGKDKGLHVFFIERSSVDDGALQAVVRRIASAAVAHTDEAAAGRSTSRSGLVALAGGDEEVVRAIVGHLARAGVVQPSPVGARPRGRPARRPVGRPRAGALPHLGPGGHARALAPVPLGLGLGRGHASAGARASCATSATARRPRPTARAATSAIRRWRPRRPRRRARAPRSAAGAARASARSTATRSTRRSSTSWRPRSRRSGARARSRSCAAAARRSSTSTPTTACRTTALGRTSQRPTVLARVDALLQAGTLRSTGGRFPKLEVA